MSIKDSFGVKVFRCINTLVLLCVIIVTLYPIVHVIMASFSDGNLLMAHRGVLLKPLGFNVGAYKKIFEYPILLRGYANTITICAISLIINMLLTSFAAYVLTRKEFRPRNVIMMIIMFTMYFNGGLIPTYMLVKNIGLLNSMWALILPSAMTTYNMIVLRTSFAAMPETLYESARIEGASHFRILFQIVIPLCKATIAVIILYYLVARWNAWFEASIYINDREKYPLQLLLREILIENDNGEMSQSILESDKQAVSETLKYAVIVAANLPILCV
ncbi:MAG: carbohydrate ABC transporter permease, partial [Clostridia bacterium]